MAYSIWVALADSDRIRSGLAAIRTVPSPLCTDTGNTAAAGTAANGGFVAEAGATSTEEEANISAAMATKILAHRGDRRWTSALLGK